MSRARASGAPRARTMDAVPLLGAKLLPPSTGPFHLRRARLQDRLSAALDGRATVVVAGPGYGKTSLVAKLVQELEGDSVWYSLDAADRDPLLFFRYLVQGIREQAADFGERSGEAFAELRPSGPDVE